MIDHGKWIKYIPTTLPQYAPPNAVYWQRGTDDWYIWSRARWNIVQGVDNSGTTKVVVSDERVIAVETDATYLSLPFEYILYELENGEPVPKPGWIFSDGSFIEPATVSAPTN
ncbi:hypothetical protein [Agrobacterium fabrum]|uniref:hypothetical protein n=1 Tax=Agrobacterium fabrum TaxID=1176649 RepID=UPI000F0C21E1|nr:hypothetical protein [Agrobacterium fabrum]AYM57326.1 hypothetical protein At1D132_13090 [Agrobacterium fabrum]NSZ11684.1 hypothetical protein [Agrobacterium fabrum]